MNCTLDDGKALASEVIHMISDELKSDTEVVLIPPFVHVTNLLALVGSSDSVKVGAQNCHHEEQGAFTGEISAGMLASVGLKYVILGHSERREYFDETDSILSNKVMKALSHGLVPIYCCGEKLDSRESGDQEAIVGKQVEEALFSLTAEQISKVVIAYEPVWAIGTGKTATAAQAQAMHRFIRSLVSDKFDSETANKISILYGGSVKPGNAKEIFAQPDVDGGLIGGASLKSRDFVDIVKAFD